MTVQVGRVLLNKNLALLVETENRPEAGPRKTYVFKCADPTCQEMIRVRQDALKTASGKCKTHSHRKRPFESIYKSLTNDWRGLEVNLTYDEFIEFTKIDRCHYCASAIDWQPYGTVKGVFTSRAYYLDRKDASLGYSKDNCVVCCTFCNLLRGNRLAYSEFLLLSEPLKVIMRAREKLAEMGSYGL